MENKRIVINKKIFIGVIVTVIILAVMLVVYNNRSGSDETNSIISDKTENTEVNDNGEKVNTSSKLKEARNVNGLYIDNIELKNVSNRTTFTANITNKTNETTKGQLYNIVFINKSGVQEESMGLYIRAIEPNKTISIEASIDKDVTECYNFNLQLR